jgi:hypothetical protein
MAFTTPGTAVAGEVLTAAFWNTQVRDNLAALNAVAINIQSTTVTAITANTTSSSQADVVGLSVSITPSSASSKILVMVDMSVGRNASAVEGYFNLVRNSTPIAVSVGATNNFTKVIRLDADITATIHHFGLMHLDSPNTTSATTYKMQWAVNAGQMFLNRRDDTGQGSTSCITAIEVKT